MGDIRRESICIVFWHHLTNVSTAKVWKEQENDPHSFHFLPDNQLVNLRKLPQYSRFAVHPL